MGDSDNGNQKRGHKSGQNKYHTIKFFISRKRNFYGYFQGKNSFHFYIIKFKRKYVYCSLPDFKKVASSHEESFIFMLVNIIISW